MVTYPKDWKIVPLGECVKEKLSYGINAPAIPYNAKYPSYIRITDITDDGKYDDDDKKSVDTNQKEKYLLKSGDILLARTGASTGKSYLYHPKDGKLVYAGFLIKASIDCENHNPRFIAGQLKTKRFWKWVAATSMRSGQPGINGKEYASFRIPVTTKQEEEAIAATLSSFDNHIDNLTALIEKKKTIRDGALADLMSGRTRLAGFSGEWEETTLGKKIDVLRGKRLVRSQLSISSSGKFPVYQNSLLPLGYHEEFNCLPESVFVIAAGNAGDIGYSKTAFWAADDCYYFEHDDNIDQKFLCYNFLNRQAEIYTQTRRTSIPRLSRDILEKIKMRIPPLAEQKAIADILTSMDTEIQNLEAERDKMQAIQAGAMEDLLTGRVRLPM